MNDNQIIRREAILSIVLANKGQTFRDLSAQTIEWMRGEILFRIRGF